MCLFSGSGGEVQTGSRLRDEVRGLDSSMIVIDIVFIRIALDVL